MFHILLVKMARAYYNLMYIWLEHLAKTLEYKFQNEVERRAIFIYYITFLVLSTKMPHISVVLCQDVFWLVI